jgi:hypothetical protein
VKFIEKHITGDSRRCAVLVTGAPLGGKKVVCQRAAGYANLVPYLHVSDESAGFLQLASTIATWFRYADIEEVQDAAESVLNHTKMKRWSRAHDECINLVNIALTFGLQACFLVDRVQFLDDFSLSLIRECLHGKSRRQRSANSRHSFNSSQASFNASQSDVLGGSGKICFLCVHVSLYHCKSAEQIVADITRSHSSLSIPIVKVCQVTNEELRLSVLQLTGLDVTDRWLETSAAAAGNCVGYFAERQAVIRNISSKLWKEGKPGLMDLNDKLESTIPPGRRRDVLVMPVNQVTGDVAMRFSHVFDMLPPLLQTFCKVLAVASRTRFYQLPKSVMWNVLNDLIAEGVENGVFNVVVDEMTDMCLLKVDIQNSEDVLSFLCPALGDAAYDVSTPVQLKAIGYALIERLEPSIYEDFKVLFVIANLHDLVGDEYSVKEELWIQGYKFFLDTCQDWPAAEIIDWKETIADEIRALGCSRPEVVMGDGFKVRCCFVRNSLSETMKLLKIYHGPIGFGPMGLSLTVITVNVYFLYGEFHGFDEERVTQVRNELTSACTRYLREMDVIEDFLCENGFPGDISVLEKERCAIREIKAPPSSKNGVEQKASLLYYEVIPTYVEDRLGRLYKLAAKLHEGATPQIVQAADDTIRLAYEALKAPKLLCEAAQDAIMIMATRNWKQKATPEYLPLLYLQTVARIRNKTLKQLSDAELVIFRHQQSPRDLEVFLIVTPLLYDAQARGRC